MELRHVQESGGTFFMSLPKEWARRVGLVKGSLLAVLESENGCLTIDPKYNLQRIVEPVTISPSHHLERELMGKYLLGADAILITSDSRLSPSVYEIARKTARRLIGLEIVEEGSNKILLQCLLEPASFPPEKVLRREYLFVAGMHRDVLTAFLESDLNLANAVVERDDEVDRLYFLLVRLLRTRVLNPRLSEKMGLPLIDCLDYRLVASYVESIGDCAVRMAKSVVEFVNTALPEDFTRLLYEAGEASYKMHETAIKAIFSRDLNLVGEVMRLNEQARGLLKGLEVQLSGRNAEVIAYSSSISSSLRSIADYCVDLADIVMPR